MELLPLSPRFWLARQAELAAFWVPAVIACTAVAAVIGASAAVAMPLAAAAVAVVSWSVERGRYRAWGYAERAEDLVVVRGLLFRRTSVVPYGRMQFIDVTAGPVERSFGLATVRMHTAAAASDARIPGLDRALAAELRDHLAALGEARAAGL